MASSGGWFVSFGWRDRPSSRRETAGLSILCEEMENRGRMSVFAFAGACIGRARAPRINVQSNGNAERPNETAPARGA
jgi:hypothetical protein